MLNWRALLGAAAALALTWGVADRAQACGGCFAPTESVTVVTGHRMAVAISPAETTLWDQFQYAGDPEDFVWVLPIAGETLVELADNAFFDALDQSTRITLQGTFPPLQTFCPDPCGGGLAFPSASRGGEDGSPTEDPVTVYGTAVVGPYETATIGSDDPEALLSWLQTNGYAVPDEILPIIAHYVDRGLNFAVLKLHPNAGVNQMQPVRVTTPGMMPVFPLRMISAGTAGSVGLELYILAEGRWEAQNFEMLEVPPSALIYDWATSRFNYNEAFDRVLADAGGRAWITEFAQPGDRGWQYNLQSWTTYDEDGTAHSSADDFAVVTRSIAAPHLTKIRTDLDVGFLDQDLILQASLDGDVESFILVDREINRPAEPRCPTACDAPGTGGGVVGTPGGALGFRSGRGDGLCAVSSRPSGAAAFGLLVTMVALVWRRRRR